MALPISRQKSHSLQMETQIIVDPISLRESISSSSSMGETSFNMMLPPIDAPQPDSAVPHPLLPTHPNFFTSTVPTPATSSPRFRSLLSWKNLKSRSHESPRQVDHEVVDDVRHHGQANDDGCRNSINFKCSGLCLFLPGLGKAKAVRPRMRDTFGIENDHVTSTRVSLEKFECGSWASSTLIPDHHEDVDGDCVMNHYFDMPLELIQNLGNDAHLPVSAAFVFHNKAIKAFSKYDSTPTAATGRKSYDSAHGFRFSTGRDYDESLFSRA
ncbi:hypothetical protein V6Z11_D10G112100 [Gossypium hirsutum]